MNENPFQDENPFQAPQTPAGAAGVLSGSRKDLHSVAKFQKGIIVCILIYLIALFGQFVLPQDIRLLVGLGILPVGLVGAVFVFLLSIKVYGAGLGIVLGILSLIPLVGFIVLLRVNGKATNVLTQNGIKVGLLGANLASITASSETLHH